MRAIIVLAFFGAVTGFVPQRTRKVHKLSNNVRLQVSPDGLDALRYAAAVRSAFLPATDLVHNDGRATSFASNQWFRTMFCCPSLPLIYNPNATFFLASGRYLCECIAHR